MQIKSYFIIKTAHQVIEDEIRTMQNLNTLLDNRFEKACQFVLKCKGRVIFTGVGHSGHVGKNLLRICRA